tara:strand:- start:14868 stop:15134 length:267 start_codon:yes stop_codon:yes gene_type:complete
MEKINTGKRYWAFAYDSFEASGGFNDWVKSSNDFDELKSFLIKYSENRWFDRGHIFDSKAQEVIDININQLWPVSNTVFYDFSKEEQE